MGTSSYSSDNPLQLSIRAEQNFFARVLSSEQSGVASPSRQYKSLYSQFDDPSDTMLLNSQPLSDDVGFLAGIREGFSPYNLINQSYKRLSEELESSLPLPKPLRLRLALDRCLFKRRSRRNFSHIKKINAQRLATILYYSAGCSAQQQQTIDWGGRSLNLHESFHTYPSAGALYPIQLYVGLRQNNAAPAGWYRYQPLSHSLLQVSDWLNDSQFTDSSLHPENAQLLVLLVYQVWRNRHKYGRSAASFALLEIGTIVQNLYLISEALGWSCCSWGGFPRAHCEQLLSLDGLSEQALHSVCIGGSE